MYAVKKLVVQGQVGKVVENAKVKQLGEQKGEGSQCRIGRGDLEAAVVRLLLESSIILWRTCSKKRSLVGLLLFGDATRAASVRASS